MIVDVCLTPYDAAESLQYSPEKYSIILISLQDLLASSSSSESPEEEPEQEGASASAVAKRRGFLESIFSTVADKSLYTIIVYGSVNPDDDQVLELLEEFGVNDVLDEPYTLASLKVK